MLINNTPFQRYGTIWVKREDLCTPSDGPRFSKIRGVYAHIKQRPETVIGVLDTYHSKAGWAVAYVGRELNRVVYDFYPEYKKEPGPREPQLRARDLGAQLWPLKAGRSAILYHQAKKSLNNIHHTYLMPNALKLPESVTETAAEVAYTPEILRQGTWVISISSGTIAAGVLEGLNQLGAAPRVILHMGYSRSQSAVEKYLASKVKWEHPLELIDEGFAYKDRVDFPVEFPCNPYYDLKAWRWLQQNQARLEPPVVFWNIGE